MNGEKTKRTTLKDIAKLANCSPSVVSIVLNQSHGNIVVGLKTQERIRKIAEELCYQPNFASRSLKMDCVQTLGICVPPGPARYVGNIYERSIFQGIDQAAQEHNYDLMLLNTRGDSPAKCCLEKLGGNRVDGILFLHLDEHAQWLKELEKYHSKLIAIDYASPSPLVDAVCFDNEQAVCLALEHLRNKGHRRIGFIGNSLSANQMDTQMRINAYRRFLLEFALDDDDMLLYHFPEPQRKLPPEENFCRVEGRDGAEFLLSQQRPPTAIIAYNDMAAVGVLDVCRRRGIEVPRVLSVIGIDDDDFCEMTFPRLTSIAHPLEEMGYAGAMRLLARLKKTAQPEEPLKFAPRLVERESVSDISYHV